MSSKLIPGGIASGSNSKKAWLSYFDLGCVSLATGLWLIKPEWGFWPLLLALIPWAIRFVIYGKPSTRTAFDLPILVFLVTGVVSVWTAYDRDMALAKFWLIVASVLIFFAFANWIVSTGRGGARQQAWSLTILGALIAFYFLATHDWEAYPAKVAVLTPLGQGIQSVIPKLPVEKFHPNIIGSILAMLAPFAGATALLAKRKHSLGEFIGAILILAFILLCLLLTTSRGAWLALAVAVGLLLWWLITSRFGQGRKRRWLFVSVPLAFLILLFLLTYLWPGGLENVLERLPAADSGLKRADLYSNSLALVSDYPFLGAGLGGFMMLYSTYALLLHVGFSSSSHNLFLDLIIDQGIIALLAVVWMWLLMGEAVWRTMAVKKVRRFHRLSHDTVQTTQESELESNRQEIDRIETKSGYHYSRVMLSASAMAIVVIIVHGLVDDALYYSRAVIIFFLPLAFAVPVLKSVQRLNWKERLQPIMLAMILISVIGVFFWRPISSLFQSNFAAIQQSKIELGTYEWPTWPIQDAVRRQLDLDDVVAGYEQALTLFPENAGANRRLGQIELSMGNYEAALAHLEKAYRLTPYDNTTRQLLGEAYLANGHQLEGTELWRSVNNEQQQLSLRQFWYGEIGEAPRQEVIQAAIRDIQ